MALRPSMREGRIARPSRVRSRSQRFELVGQFGQSDANSIDQWNERERPRPRARSAGSGTRRSRPVEAPWSGRRGSGSARSCCSIPPRCGFPLQQRPSQPVVNLTRTHHQRGQGGGSLSALLARDQKQQAEYSLRVSSTHVPRLSTEPGVPAERCPLVLRRLLLGDQEAEFERLDKTNVLQLGGGRHGFHQVAVIEGSTQTGVGRALGSHERMFSYLGQTLVGPRGSARARSGRRRTVTGARTGARTSIFLQIGLLLAVYETGRHRNACKPKGARQLRYSAGPGRGPTWVDKLEVVLVDFNGAVDSAQHGRNTRAREWPER